MFAVRSSEHDDAHRHGRRQRAIVRAQPEQARRVPEPLSAVQRFAHLLEIRADRKDSALADQPVHLARERIECGEEDQSQRAQKDPARHEDVGRTRCERPE